MRRPQTTRPLLVGEAPSRRTDGGPPFSGRSGARLAALAAVGELGDAFDVVNLFDRWPGRAGKGSRFPIGEARRRAAEIELAGQVVFVGARVAAAFGFSDLVPCRWYRALVPGAAIAMVPHPSGLNRWWNDPANVRRARRFLRSL